MEPSWEPISNITNSGGYTDALSNKNLSANSVEIQKLAAKILQDPILQIKLGDRVYELMHSDLQQQRERRLNS